MLRPSAIDRIVQAEFESVATARMDGIALSSGRYVSVINGEDLVSTNWITESYGLLEATPGLAVVHPEITVAFGEQRFVAQHDDSDDPDFDFMSTLERNPWASTITTYRSVFANIG